MADDQSDPKKGKQKAMSVAEMISALNNFKVEKVHVNDVFDELQADIDSAFAKAEPHFWPNVLNSSAPQVMPAATRQSGSGEVTDVDKSDTDESIVEDKFDIDTVRWGWEHLEVWSGGTIQHPRYTEYFGHQEWVSLIVSITSVSRTYN